MKKFSVLLLTGILAFGLTACGEAAGDNQNNTTDTTVQTTTDAGNNSTDNADNGTADENQGETEPEVTAPVLPEVKGVTHDMDFELIGCNFTLDYSEEGPVIRLWFKITNNSTSFQSPSYLASWDGLVVTQGEEALRGYMTKDNYLEDQVTDRNILPGTTVVFTETYKMVSDTEVIKCVLTADDDAVTEFEFDPATFVEVIPETYTWTPVNEYDWFESAGDVYSEYTEVSYSIADIQVIDGKDWMSRNNTTNVRIVLDVTNNSDKEKTVHNVFTPYQDGVELELGTPGEYDDEVDIKINTKIPAGETRQIAVTYVLYNDSTPVLFVAKDYKTYYGQVFQVK